MSRARLLDAAKAAALALAEGYAPPPEAVLPAGGAALSDRLLARMEAKADLAPHDRAVGAQVARVLSGGEAAGEITEGGMLALELGALVTLARTPQTQDRIGHMLATGRPLRN
jgi:3-hydroxyacyl-CoA dehydrogenase